MGDSKLLYYKYKAFLRQVFRQQQRGSANITAKQTIYIKKEQALIETRKSPLERNGGSQTEILNSRHMAMFKVKQNSAKKKKRTQMKGTGHSAGLNLALICLKGKCK